MSEPKCIDLRKLFGDAYRITRDESSESPSDPWTMQIPCRRGCTIVVWGGSRLAVMVDGRRTLARQVAAIPGVRMEQGGDDELTFSFDVSLFEEIAAIVQPKRRRRLTEEQRAACAARLAQHQFRPARTSGQVLAP